MGVFKVNFSTSYQAKRKRIERLPEYMLNMAKGYAKRDAEGLIKEFQNGIKFNNMRLEKLKQATIKEKMREGLSRPSTPLYGLGETDEKSYINMMRIRKIQKSSSQVAYTVYPSWAKHHKSDLPLKALFIVHEFGTIIKTKRGIIRIPPRPAFYTAYRRFMNKRKRLEPAKEVRQAITNYVNTGKDALMRKIEERKGA